MRVLFAMMLLFAYPAAAWDTKHTEEQRIDIANTVQKLGYVCEYMKDMHHLAWTTRGQQVKISCGPPDRDEIRWAYRMTIRPNHTVSIDPCHVLLCGASE